MPLSFTYVSNLALSQEIQQQVISFSFFWLSAVGEVGWGGGGGGGGGGGQKGTGKGVSNTRELEQIELGNKTSTNFRSILPVCPSNVDLLLAESSVVRKDTIM